MRVAGIPGRVRRPGVALHDDVASRFLMRVAGIAQRVDRPGTAGDIPGTRITTSSVVFE